VRSRLLQRSPVRLCDFLFSFKHPGTAVSDSLSLHDALPISACDLLRGRAYLAAVGEPAAVQHHRVVRQRGRPAQRRAPAAGRRRSEEHTSELQSLTNLVCRLLLEKTNTPTSFSSLRP